MGALIEKTDIGERAAVIPDFSLNLITSVAVCTREPRQFPRPALPPRCEAQPVEIRGLVGQTPPRSQSC
jgi:hypothetical protein